MSTTDLVQANQLAGAFYGMCRGIHIVALANKRIHPTTDKMQLSSVIHKVSDEYQEDPRRILTIWKSSVKTWDSFEEFYLVLKDINDETRREADPEGGAHDMSWMPGFAPRTHVDLGGNGHPLHVQRALEEFAHYSNLYLFAQGIHQKDPAQDKQLLKYISLHFQRLSGDLEKLGRVSMNVALYRLHIRNRNFEKEEFVVNRDLWKAGLQIPKQDRASDGTGARNDQRLRDIAQAAALKAMGSRQLPVQAPQGNRAPPAAPPSNDRGGKGGFDRKGVVKKPAYRSCEADLNGRPYTNQYGESYSGSLCDHCEKKFGANARKYYHHPLECNDQFPEGSARDWRGNEPPTWEEADSLGIYFRIKDFFTKAATGVVRMLSKASI